MTFVLIVVALAIVAGVALFVSGDGGRMPDVDPDREPVDLPPDRLVQAHDLDRTRFALGVRGYRMDQVDAVLDRLADDLRLREEYLQEIVALAETAGLEVPAPPAPAVGTAPADGALPEPSDDDEAPALKAADTP